MLAAGHEVVWVTSDGTGSGQPPPTHPRFRLLRVRAWHGVERAFGIAYPLFAPSLAVHLWREVRAADVVHVHGLVFLGSPLATLFARLAGRWSLATDHGGLQRYRFAPGTLLLRLLFATVGRVTAHTARALVAYNRDVETLLVRLSGDSTKVAFVPNPVDAALFHPPTADQRSAARTALGWDDTPRVLCVSRLLPHKGIDVLLQAQDPAWRLVFCGPGTEAMQQHIRAAGAECLPPRPREQLVAIYHAADVFALPSHNEGFPVVVQEALACGLPVLTSDLPAYAPYRHLDGLHLAAPTPTVVHERLRALVQEPRRLASTSATSPRADGTAAAGSDWLRQLCAGMPPPTLRRSRWLAIAVALLLLVHVAFGLSRWPVGAVQKRAASIAEFRERGDVDWYLRHYDDETRRIVHWLRASVADDEYVRFEGFRQGAMQFVAPLLFPRLLVDVEVADAPRATSPGAGAPPLRPFTARPPWLPADARGTPVLLAYPGHLRVELR